MSIESRLSRLESAAASLPADMFVGVQDWDDPNLYHVFQVGIDGDWTMKAAELGTIKGHLIRVDYVEQGAKDEH